MHQYDNSKHYNHHTHFQPAKNIATCKALKLDKQITLKPYVLNNAFAFPRALTHALTANSTTYQSEEWSDFFYKFCITD
jgi:hypothetical protein